MWTISIKFNNLLEYNTIPYLAYAIIFVQFVQWEML